MIRFKAGKTEAVRKSSLEDTPLGVDREALWKAFEPFALPENAENAVVWRDGVKRQRKRIAKNLRRKYFGGKPKVAARTTQVITDSYAAKWNEIGYANYDIAKKQGNYAPWLWGDRRFLASTYGSARFRHLLLAAVIERLQPKTVLEVGCGNGINLLLLANRFPHISFAGVELTDAGPGVFDALRSAGALPANLVDYAPLPARDPTAFQQVSIRQGTAERLEFADGSVDLVMSILALEQMERIRRTALQEMARVCSRWTLMIEPFREVNGYLWPRFNILRQDYFQGRVRDLPRFGLHPMIVTDDFPQEIHLRACMALCGKAGSDGALEPAALAAE
ncbi:class I SAM-dependent methyltransferase [Pelagibius sp.]|uniref:class I SAM-dependent methyltransferase n=1 Tax=Pelagibius sp. TaxID=1931238 RepID=UPI003B505AE4